MVAAQAVIRVSDMGTDSAIRYDSRAPREEYRARIGQTATRIDDADS